MKHHKKAFSKHLLLLPLILSLSFAQGIQTVSFQTGSLQTHVDTYRGNFSIYNIDELNLDFMSFLFGGSTTPSSFFRLFVDRKEQTLDQMQALYPLGVSLGSQIDGTYLAGEEQDIQADIAFFALDMLNNGDLNSVGFVINVSNISDTAVRRIGTKIMLDTDIGESRNDPLIYLPNGDKISNAMIFNSNQPIPPFLFIGQKNATENRPIGKGFYIYPYLSGTTPTSIVVGNWKRLSEQSWIPNSIQPSLSYTNDSIKDAGVSLCFGDITLQPSQTAYFGFIVSTMYNPVQPVLEEESISQGVLSTDRFRVEELLNYVPTTRGATNNIPNNNINTPLQMQRERYRIQQLFSNIFTNNQTPTITNSLSNLIDDDSIWRYLYRLDHSISNTTIKLDAVLSNEQNSTNITNFSIYKERLFDY